MPPVTSGTLTALEGTRNTFALLGSTRVPGPGSVRRMSPASMSASKAGSPTVTVKPARSMVATASSVATPRTSGTVSASATRSDTALPLEAVVPAAGVDPSTAPGSASGSKMRCRGPTVNPATTNLFSASSADLPATSGTFSGAGPAESTRMTAPPTGSGVPATGVVRKTLPAGTASSNAGEVPTTAARSAATRAAFAASVVVPAGIFGTCGRPLDTSRSTSEPRSTLVPGVGSELATTPRGTVS